MHITDLLFQARKERDEAQQRYEQVLADHRATYPWLSVEEGGQQPAEDMSDPSNWRAGDVMSVTSDEPDTHGFRHGDLVTIVDADSFNVGVLAPLCKKGNSTRFVKAKNLRFIRRP